MRRAYYVYILANRKCGALYVGVTNNLDRRVLEHKHDIHDDSFSKRYQIHRLVYYEIYTDIREAIKREKQLKKWNRDWKIRLIEENNKDWFDLSSGSPLEFIPIESGRG